jgi:hypothetical protein
MEQELQQDDFYFDRESKETMFTQVNTATKHVSVLSQTAIKNKISSHDYDKFKKEKVVNAYFRFRPDKNVFYFEEDGRRYFNTYRPPHWLKDQFNNSEEFTFEKTNCPPLYVKFFKHLTNNDKESIEYIYDWVANSLLGRKNECYLTLIGNSGVGKGVFAKMLRLIHEESYHCTNQRYTESQFNGTLCGKTLLYLNEIQVQNDTQSNKIKLLSDDEIEIEAKGKETIKVDNFINVLITTNNIDNFRMGPDDRRLSIVNLNADNLQESLTSEEITKFSTDKEMNKQFVNFLLTRPIKNNMNQKFEGEYAQEIQSMNLEEHELWIINEYIPSLTKNHPVSVRDFQPIILKEFPDIKRYGRTKLMSLQKIGGFEVKKRNIPGTKKLKQWAIIKK